ncbi:MAG: hypothetical protein JJU20_04250 [Opitutales bacterium]|nr:hypothetical protein [Opitutales bacterium]
MAVPQYGSHSNEEFFAYDDLHRLIGSNIGYLGEGVPPPVHTYYDNFGNLLEKEGVENEYDSTYFMRLDNSTVTGIGGIAYSYNFRGQVTLKNHVSGPGWQAIDWLPFGQPESISTNTGASYTYTYDTRQQRIREVRSNGEDRRFASGGQYERIHYPNSSIRHRHIIPLPGGATGMVEFMDGQPQSTGDEYYLLSDLLGSSTMVLSRLGTSGGVADTYAYDAWGNPRDPDTWNTYGFQTAWPAHIGNRGYGGHEMLEDVSMVHMGGRIYDPVSSRFLSPDPYVQSPNNLQNYNRYSYVLNNPMSFTDPSGFLFDKIAGWIGDVFSGIGNALGSMWKTIRPYVGTVVTVALAAFPATAPFAGIIGGAVGAIANGGSVGDFLMGMGIGMFAGAIAQDWATSIGGYFSLASDHLGQAMISGAVIGAVSGAMSAAVYGQNVWKGVRSGAAWGSATAAMVHLVRPAPKVGGREERQTERVSEGPWIEEPLFEQSSFGDSLGLFAYEYEVVHQVERLSNWYYASRNDLPALTGIPLVDNVLSLFQATTVQYDASFRETIFVYRKSFSIDVSMGGGFSSLMGLGVPRVGVRENSTLVRKYTRRVVKTQLIPRSSLPLEIPKVILEFSTERQPDI